MKPDGRIPNPRRKSAGRSRAIRILATTNKRMPPLRVYNINTNAPSGTTMNRHLRKVALISGTTLCLLIAAAFVASRWWSVTLFPSKSSWIGASSGGFEFCTGAWYLNRPGWAAVERHDDALLGWNFWMRRPSKPPGAVLTL